MNKRLINSLIISLMSYSMQASLFASDASSTTVITKIAFGSCASENKPQPIWDAIVTENPDLFLFVGDNIYGDTEDMSVLKHKYSRLMAKSGYQKLLKTCPILSTWDDHDYGKNDGGSEYPMRNESAEVFLDFFKVPDDSPRRSRAGIYGAQIFGKPGQRVQIILLDTRYFRSSPLIENTMMSGKEKKEKNLVGWYLPITDTSTTLLGLEQWTWLEKQLNEKADLRIIASSIQVVSQEKGMECWGNFPHERQRLFNLIENTKANGVVFISGDVHFSEISADTTGPYPFYDFTSSGLTNSSKSWSQTVNSLRIGNAYSKPNFGLITIDWANKGIKLESKSVEGKMVIKKEITLNELMIKRSSKFPVSPPRVENDITI
tara:strand:- start:46 stop:1173 length:1128 start_codon:yes stop_codon:yes gene_type:complete